jgi:hypothetical protein
MTEKDVPRAESELASRVAEAMKNPGVAEAVALYEMWRNINITYTAYVRSAPQPVISASFGTSQS